MAQKLKSKVPEKLKDLTLPNGMVEKLWPRIQLFLEKYHRDQMLKSRWTSSGYLKDSGMTMQQLCLSCYLQGVSDGNELPKV